MTNINLQSLYYIAEIARTGSINQTAGNLHLSQSALSRVVKDLESQIGITLFQRTNKGVRPTEEGQLFLDRSRNLIQEADKLQQQYFHPALSQNTLRIASQRCTPVVSAFILCYQKYFAEKTQMDLALLEETTDRITELVCSGIYGIGILHYTSDQETVFLKHCEELGLCYHILEKSPICIQVRKQHPLADLSSISMEQLAAFPRVVLSNEDLTHLSDSSPLVSTHPGTSPKQLTVCERGTLHQILEQTNAYHIGCNFQRFAPYHERPFRYIPLEQVDFTLNTIWVHHQKHTLTNPERCFVSLLEEFYATASDA